MKDFYDLDIDKFALGIDEVNFVSPFTAIVSPSALYKGKEIYQLLKYKSDGHYYNYNGDGYCFYDPTQPTAKSSFFVRFEPILLFENETSRISSINIRDKYTNLSCLSFLFERLDISKKMYGIIKLSSFTKPSGKYFGLNYNIFDVNEINKLEILRIFNELSTMEIFKILKEYKFVKEIII